MLNETKPKTFWQKPEGIPGAILLATLIGGGIWGLSKAMPFLLELAQNTIYLIGMIVVICAFFGAVLNPNVRATVWLKYKAMLRTMTGWIINLDPIGIMKAYIQTLREKREVMNEHLTLLNGELKKVEREIGSNEATENMKMREAQAAQKQLGQATDETEQLRLKGAMNLAAREAKRMQESNLKLKPLQQQINTLYKMINKLYISSEFLIADMDADVKAKEREYRSIKEASNAVNAARSVFGSGGADMEVFNQSAEALQEDIGNRVGAITRFMDNTQSVLTSIDVKNGMLEEEGLRMLEEFNDKQFNAIFNSKLGAPEPEKIKILAKSEQSQAAGKFNDLI